MKHLRAADAHATVRQLYESPAQPNRRLYACPSPFRTPKRGDVRASERRSVLEKLPSDAGRDRRRPGFRVANVSSFHFFKGRHAGVPDG
jgi:hypothetical protein